MFGAWEVSPYWLLDEWICSVDFLQVRRVERAAETRRNFCFWLPSGLILAFMRFRLILAVLDNMV
jgi:hypothetical protein